LLTFFPEKLNIFKHHERRQVKMERGRLKEAVLIVALALFLGITPPAFADQPAAGTAPEKITAENIKEEGADLSRTLKDYSIRQKNQAVKTSKEALAEMDVRIDRMENRLSEKWSRMDAAAREKARATMKALRQKRTETAEWFGGMKQSSTAAWKDVKKGFSRSYEDLKDAFREAEREY